MHLEGACAVGLNFGCIIGERDVPTRSCFCKIGSLVGVSSVNELKGHVLACRVNFQIGLREVEPPSRNGLHFNLKVCLADNVAIGHVMKGDVRRGCRPCHGRDGDAERESGGIVDGNRRCLNRCSRP